MMQDPMFLIASILAGGFAGLLVLGAIIAFEVTMIRRRTLATRRAKLLRF